MVYALLEDVDLLVHGGEGEGAWPRRDARAAEGAARAPARELRRPSARDRRAGSSVRPLGAPAIELGVEVVNIAEAAYSEKDVTRPEEHDERRDCREAKGDYAALIGSGLLSLREEVRVARPSSRRDRAITC